MKRELAYKGSFYPDNIEDINKFISDNCEKIERVKGLKGIILPHAGWIYSGVTALKGLCHLPYEEIERIYLIGPSHRFNFKGVALSRFQFYETLSGDFTLDKNREEILLNLEGVSVLDDAHLYEHSLEVELEFLKHFYPKALLVPLVAGNEAKEAIKNILNISLNEKEALTVISSDLSHYLTYNEAVKEDRKTLTQIESHTLLDDYNQACGAVIINAFLTLNIKEDFKTILFDYRNSGDTAGDKKSVVGYASLGIVRNE